MDPNVVISLIAVLIAILGFAANLWFSSRQIRIMEQDLRQELFAGLELHIVSKRFAPREREFPLLISKSGKGYLTDLRLCLRHLPSNVEIAVSPSEPLFFTQGDLIRVDIFPELDALFQGLGVYDHTRMCLLKEVPIPVDILCTWMNVNSGAGSKSLSLIAKPEFSRSNQVELMINQVSETD